MATRRTFRFHFFSPSFFIGSGLLMSFHGHNCPSIKIIFIHPQTWASSRGCDNGASHFIYIFFGATGGALGVGALRKLLTLHIGSGSIYIYIYYNATITISQFLLFCLVTCFFIIYVFIFEKKYYIWGRARLFPFIGAYRCVCVCVCMFMWFMRTHICIMTWVWHRYYKEKVIYEDNFSVPRIQKAYKSCRVSFFEKVKMHTVSCKG